MSLKQSVQNIQTNQNAKRNFGNLGEDDLKNAINLLFIIKGKTIKKKSPEFIIPTAEEFFYFCRSTSEDIYQKTVHKKLHRPLSLERLDINTTLLDFLETIHETQVHTVYDRLCICIYTVLYALCIYNYTRILFKLMVDPRIKEKKRIIHSENFLIDYKSLFLYPMQFFCVHVMSYLEKSKKEIMTLCFNFFQTHIVPEMSEKINDGNLCKSESVYKTAQELSIVFSSIVIEQNLFESELKKSILTTLKLTVL